MVHLDQRRWASLAALQDGAVADAYRSGVLLRGHGLLGKAHGDGRHGSAGAGGTGDYQGSSRPRGSAAGGCSVADASSAHSAGPHHRLRRHYHGRVAVVLLDQCSRSPVQIDQSWGRSLDDSLAVDESRVLLLHGGCVQVHLRWLAAGIDAAVLGRNNELSVGGQSVPIQDGHGLSHCRCLDDGGCGILCNASTGCLHDNFSIGYGCAILEGLWLLSSGSVNDKYWSLDRHAWSPADGGCWRYLGKRRGGDS